MQIFSQQTFPSQQVLFCEHFQIYDSNDTNYY